MRKRLVRSVLTLAALSIAAAGSAGIIDALKVMRNNKPPSGPFDAADAPPAPDYGRAASWVALPDTQDGADISPAGMTPIDQRRAPADVFFIYPTVFFSQTAWNADIADPAYRAQITALPIRSQASIFNGCCAIYAPHYRQMTLGGFVKWSASSEGAMDLAYRDVARAFDVFLARYNRGRPFIIAGHSQGSRLARRLIAERIDGTPLARRMVAAYLVGHWVEADWFSHLRTTRPCIGATDSGCLISWSTFAEGRDGAAQRRLLGSTSNYAPEKQRRPYVCINPLSWRADTVRVPKTRNRGGWMPGEGSGALPAVTPDMVSARCKDGALYISKPPRAYQDKVIPFGNYHNVDYNLFYANVRDNAIERVAAFRR